MPPAKFKPKRDKSKAGKATAALARLRDRWRTDQPDGYDEDWEPESEPLITPMLKAVPGGITFCLQALRCHDEDDARDFLETYDQCTKSDRAVLTIEQIAHASGIGSLRLAEVIQTALYLYGDRQAQMILSASMPKVIKSTVKAATDEVPIVADTLQGRVVVGKTNGDTRAMEMLLKSRGILPIPKGSQIAIQVNTEKAEKQETGHTWKYPEERLKEITAIINPKQLEAPRTVPSDRIHFDANRPMVFER
jgi:hypothetical protein